MREKRFGCCGAGDGRVKGRGLVLASGALPGPKGCRKDRLQRLTEGTEVMMREALSQFEKGWSQKRGLIQKLFNLLNTVCGTFLQKTDGVSDFPEPPEGSADPLADRHPSRKRRRNFVIENSLDRYRECELDIFQSSCHIPLLDLGGLPPLKSLLC